MVVQRQTLVDMRWRGCPVATRSAQQANADDTVENNYGRSETGVMGRGGAFWGSCQHQRAIGLPRLVA